ncbi:hypothetical protein GGS23DRAFT_552946 [Durotheca rogersii]|uniref:uncharacterized protein n=1 Tax=Durotheca rogersii TaxID=419775 RepID=UPI0022210288|nr:uncharacterized protein GGS23DRAFT_552946 [Durotheca rogersii]KAI5866976.1 hypothetical protein GGS23DRAFT_552946 [Durotheca rogersii]
MASRILTTGPRNILPLLRHAGAPRALHATARALADTAAPLPARKPIGAFRGGLFGFLLGATAAGAGVYSYVLREYKASNELLTEDIYALQTACQRLSTHVQNLEEKIDAAERKRK